MTVSTTASSVSYVGNGATNTWTVPFKVFDKTHLTVTAGGVVQSQSAFSFSGAGNETGTVTYPLSGSLASGVTLEIRRTVPLKQETVLDNQGGFFPEAVEGALDRLVMADQQAERRADGLSAALVSGNLIDSLATLSGSSSAQVLKALGYITPEAFGATGDGVVDDTTALQTAVNSLGAGGGVVVCRGKYRITSAVTVPDQVTLRGDLVRPEQQDVGESPYQLGSQIVSTVGTGTAPSIILGRGSAVEGMAILRGGLPLPVTTVTAANALPALFDGCAVQMNGTGGMVRDCLIAGFDHAVRAVLAGDEGRVALSHVLIDCENGVLIQGAGDVCQVEAVEGWPLLTAHVSGVGNTPSDPTSLRRAGTFLQMTSVTGAGNDWSQIVRCMEYGYAIGYDALDASNVQFINCQSDYTNPNTGGVAAFRVRGASNVRIFSPTSIGKPVALSVNSTTSGERSCELLHPFFANTSRCIEVVDGDVDIIGGEYREATDTCIDVGAGAGSVLIDGPTFLTGSVGVRVNASYAGRLVISSPRNVGVTTLFSIPDALLDRIEMADVTVKSFGAKGDGASDDTAALLAAVAQLREVVFPPGNYRFGSTLALTRDGHTLRGSGRGVTTLTCTSTTARAITLAEFSTRQAVVGLRVTRSGTPTGTASGIHCLGQMSQAAVRDVVIDGHFVGAFLSATDYSDLENAIIEKNLSHGVQMVNTAGMGALQWYLNNVLSQKNAGIGFVVGSVAGPAAVALGTWTGVRTYANSSYGVAVLGIAAVPINGLRLVGAFLGEDANDEVYLDSYGGLHIIQPEIIELTGRTPTGPTLATAASNVGTGVNITGNNTDVLIVGGRINGASNQGVLTSATRTTVVGVTVTNNGLSGSGGSGIAQLAGKLNVIGCVSGNTGGGTTQQNGVFLSTDGGGTITGNDLAGNAAAAIVRSVAMPNTKIDANIGSNIVHVGRPTSSAGLQTGDEWVDAGVVKVA